MGRSSSPLDKGGGEGGLVSPQIFLALQASVWSKNKEGEAGAAPGPSPVFATVMWKEKFREIVQIPSKRTSW